VQPADTRQPSDRPAPVITHAPAELDNQDPIVLNLLRLAAETMIAHPEAIPPDLLSLLDDYAADLHAILSPPPRREVAADT
jgi:hypothetical protein